MTGLKWKPDWALARQALAGWWNHEGLALAVYAPKDHPWENLPEPEKRDDPKDWWLDVDHWTRNSLYHMSRTFCGGAAFPCLNTNIGGPGSLGLFLGAEGHPAPSTLWYSPCITDLKTHPPLRLEQNKWWKLHLDLLQLGRSQARGRFLVGFPDLIENIDTLAQLREGQDLLVDMIEDPGWVKAKLAEINVAFFQAYDAMLPYVTDPWDGSTFCAFSLWGPGKVAKVQCDFSCMISAEMFREFVVPPLAEQCAWLDHSMYHLDGTQALHHLDALLEIDALDAIEWTPQSGLPGGGSPEWYDIYRKIKAAGKSVQAIRVAAHEVEPLINAVGADGMYIVVGAETEAAARALLRRCGWRGEA